MPDNLKDWSEGDPLSASHWQEGVAALRSLLNVPGAGQGNIKADHGVWRFAIRVGIIVNTGPASEADYTDERYWVKDVSLDSNAGINDQVTFTPVEPRAEELPYSLPDGTSSVTVPTTFTVTNLPELVSHSHTQQVGKYVWYFTLVDGQDNPVSHCVMSEGGSGVLPILCGAPTARGFYAGTIMIPATGNIDPTSDISSAAIFNTGATHVILANLVEMGILQGSTLIQGLTYNALYHSTNDDGTQVYTVSGWDVGAGLMRVPITQVGGSVGTSTSPSTWTYDAAGGLLSAASPTVGRPNGALSAATEGLLYYDFSSNAMKLLYAFEGLPTGPCVPSS